MIFWIASYPKSGNTWLRILISCYYYTENGIFYENVFKKIGQFPEKMHFQNFEYDKNIVDDTSKYWIKAQEKINNDNKLKFFKTHNAFGALNNNHFTDSKNSIGAIYVVRDPRNIITSLKNHYELNDDQALQWMTNEKNFIYDVQKFNENGYSDFQFVSSWATNLKSWKLQKKIPIKIIKYEDLLNETYVVFKEVVEFINKTTNNKQKIDKDKLKNSVNTNLLILDEVFDSSLDEGGTDEFLKILHTLDDNTDTFIISHKGESMNEKFQNIIEFEKINNFSKIK